MFPRILLFISIVGFCFPHAGYAQVQELVMIRIVKDKNVSKDFNRYTIILKNISDSPVCVLHSIFINLFENPPQKLAVFEKEKSTELFSLEYSAKDTSYDYEGGIVNFNAEAILPLQEIKFNIQLPQSTNEKKLKLEYLILPDFCYSEFKNTIFENTTTWYLKYKRIKKIVGLPN